MVIQPGLIRTEFSATAAGEIRAEDGPYAEFNAEVARATEDAYEKGPLARFGGGPEKVAQAIFLATQFKRPGRA